VRINFHNGAWGELEVSSDEHLNLHMAATCLHYGQEAFEGLKAFRGKDGKVRIFRLEENAARLQSTCQGILMAELPTERFKEAILKVVKLNERFIPPYETGASLYIRPLLIGTSAQVGVHPAEEYMFVVFVTPVALTSKVVSLPIRTLSFVSLTVPLLMEQVFIKWVATMQPVFVLTRRHMIWAIPASSTLMQKKRNILMNVVLPTSSVLRIILISLRNHLLSYLLLPIRA